MKMRIIKPTAIQATLYQIMLKLDQKEKRRYPEGYKNWGWCDVPLQPCINIYQDRERKINIGVWPTLWRV